jgi:amino acid permease
MLPAFGAMAVSVLMAYPLNVHPCRYTLEVMLCQQWGARTSMVRHCVWTVLISTAALLVSLYVPGINVVFSVMGSTSSAFVCFVLPAAFGLRLRLPEASGPLGRAGCWALLVGGALLGAVATAVTISGILADAGRDPSEPQTPPQSHACRRQC